jgi:hypothetical protein
MWCHQTGPLAGYPLSWAHYVVGIDWISRHRARTKLDMRDASRMAQPGMDAAARTRWQNEHMLAAEW